MEILIATIYGSLCWLVFKVFKVPVNKWSVTTAIMGGFLLLFFTVVLMNYNHPFTTNSRVYFVSTPIIPNVSGEVTDVKILSRGQEVKDGDTLFVMDNSLYVSELASLEAQLQLAETRYRQSKELADAGAGNTYDVEAYYTEIRVIKANMIKAKFNLRSCVVTAPSDGYIAQNRLREGMRAVQFPLRPVMTHIAKDKKLVVGAFPQNPIQRLEEGNEAEVAFDAIPGRVFKGKVIKIGEFVAQGELQAFGNLYNFDTKQYQGSVPILIELEPEIDEYNLPGGAKAQMAIYSNYMHPVMIIRKMLLRMKSWLNFLFGEH